MDETSKPLDKTSKPLDKASRIHGQHVQGVSPFVHDLAIGGLELALLLPPLGPRIKPRAADQWLELFRHFRKLYSL